MNSKSPFHPGVNLASKSTCSSYFRSRKEVGRKVDSLDLILTGVYDHHTQWMTDKRWTVRQASESERTSHQCSMIKPELKEERKPTEKSEIGESLFVYHDKSRNILHHVPINIPSNHLPSTLRGFGQKAN